MESYKRGFPVYTKLLDLCILFYLESKDRMIE